MPKAVGVAAQIATRRAMRLATTGGMVWFVFGLACLGAGLTVGAVLAPNPPVSLGLAMAAI
tara:strand:- start:243 stop:425 length:183 start_codon:yes stop_codon:yes gene_type:complete